MLMCVPRAHLQLDAVVLGKCFGARQRHIDIERPPACVRHDESVLTVIVGPRSDVLHVGAACILGNGTFVRDRAVVGHAIGDGRAGGEVVGHRHLPYMVVARREALGQIVEEAQNACIFVIDGKEVVAHDAAVATAVDDPLPTHLGCHVVAESVRQVGQLVALVPRQRN